MVATGYTSPMGQEFILSSVMFSVQCELHGNINTSAYYVQLIKLSNGHVYPCQTYIPWQQASTNQRRPSVVEINAGITRPAIGVYTMQIHNPSIG